jgi:PadR family transcriptional regulator AphA
MQLFAYSYILSPSKLAEYDMSLKHAILTLLETEQGSGYDLLKRFKQRLGFFWNASHQQIYLQLKKMTEEGLLTFDVEEQSGKPNRKVYRVTEDGHQALMVWFENPVKVDKVNDALLVKLYAGHLVDKKILLQEIQQHKTIHQRMLDTFLALEEEFLSLSPQNKTQYELPYLTLRRGILGEQAWLAWASEVELFLSRKH